jgi:hypothetical protein
MGLARKEASMRKTLAFAVVLAGLGTLPAFAEDWERLKAAAIVEALSSRVLAYPGGILQDFMADGRTLYGDSTGRWEVRGDLYCSVWPPSDRWSCYAVDRKGPDIRFTAEDGSDTVGRYVDLQ